MRRTERLFALAEALRARRTGITAEQLAERFNVTVRTMYRDLDALRDASLPLHAERGRGGGYALDRAYSLPPVNFTAREAALLVTLGRWATEMKILPFDRTLASALDKVRGALPTKGQRELAQLARMLDFIGVPARSGKAEVRQVLEEALFESREMELVYRGANEVITTRRVRLKSIVMERSETLLNCHDVAKDDARQFKLDRIEKATLVPRALDRAP
jgi:predicted DNA-binding transcriptional regulator YafY